MRCLKCLIGAIYFVRFYVSAEVINPRKAADALTQPGLFLSSREPG